MWRRRVGVAAAVVLASAGMAGCVVPPPLTPAPTASEPAPAPPAPTTTSAEPATAAPTPTPSPSPATLGPVLDGDGCSVAFIEAATFGYDAQTFRDGFLHPELLEGFEVPCSGTQPSDILPTVAEYSFAVVPAADGVLETLDTRILGTGLEPDRIVWGIYQDAAGDPIAFLNPMPEWQEVNDVAFDDAEDWVIVSWYEKP